MDRKEFIRTGCQACFFGTAALLFGGMEGCSPAYTVFKTDERNKQLSVPLQLFDKSPMQIVRPNGWQYDIAVSKQPDGSYQALLMQCTHMENQLTVAAKGFTCSLHGSRFDAAGHVVKGPAERSLKQFTTSLENAMLVIHT